MIIKQIFTEPETEVKWYFDSIEEIVIVYIRNRLRGTFACACYTLRLGYLSIEIHILSNEYSPVMKPPYTYFTSLILLCTGCRQA